MQNEAQVKTYVTFLGFNNVLLFNRGGILDGNSSNS